jgi:hypothetical protein
VRWLEWKAFLRVIELNLKDYSEWCAEQARILDKTPRFQELLNQDV